MCSSSGGQNCITQPLVSSHLYVWWYPVYLSQYLTNLMHKICFTISFISCLYMFRAHVLIIWYHHTYRCDDTRGCVMQFWPPDDKHMCSKHVEAWNKTYSETRILCIKLVKYWDSKKLISTSPHQSSFFFPPTFLFLALTGAVSDIHFVCDSIPALYLKTLLSH